MSDAKPFTLAEWASRQMFRPNEIAEALLAENEFMRGYEAPRVSFFGRARYRAASWLRSVADWIER